MLAATRPTALRALPPMAAAIMLLCAPGYAETLSPSERWALVHMVRTFRQP